MGKTVTSRLPDDMVQDIEKISTIEKLDKSSVIRRLLDKAISLWKIEYALKLFKDKEISLGKAAEICELSIWTFLLKLKEEKIPIHYDLEELRQDLALIDQEF